MTGGGSRHRAVVPPTWKQLTARAARLGITTGRGVNHVVLLDEDGAERNRFTSWVTRTADAVVLRMATAAALAGMEGAT